MTATNQQMTCELLADLSALAAQLQAKAEANDDRDTAVMAYAVQRACLELEESRREFTAANATIHNLELKVAQVVAENGQMLRFLTDISENHVEYLDEGEDCMFAGVPLDYVSEINMYVSRDVNAENPFKATDAHLAEVRAQTIRDALDSSSNYLDTDCVMDRLDISYEDAELRTSGAIELHDALVAIASELRQGAAHE